MPDASRSRTNRAATRNPPALVDGGKYCVITTAGKLFLGVTFSLSELLFATSLRRDTSGRLHGLPLDFVAGVAPAPFAGRDPAFRPLDEYTVEPDAD